MAANIDVIHWHAQYQHWMDATQQARAAIEKLPESDREAIYACINLAFEAGIASPAKLQNKMLKDFLASAAKVG